MNNIAYLHTTDFHPAHGSFAKAVNADFISVDKYFSYYHSKSRIKRYISWLYTVIRFPKRYDIIIVDEESIQAFLLKNIFFNRKIKIISTMGGTTLNKLSNNSLPKLSSIIVKYIIKNYDGYIMIGDNQYSLGLKLGLNEDKMRRVFVGVNNSRISQLNNIKINFEAPKLISICNLSEEFFYIKGIDIMIEVFMKFKNNFPYAEYTIVGGFKQEDLNKFKSNHPKLNFDLINFVGHSDSIDYYLEKANIYFHISRFDTFGISVIEAMHGSLITIVSENVGAKSILKENDNLYNLLVTKSEDVNDTYSKLMNIWDMSKKEKLEISEQLRRLSESYTEENSKKLYKEYFSELTLQ